MRASFLRLALFLNAPLLIFTAFPTPTPAAQSKTFSAITGSVTDDKGFPLAGAVISILREGKVKDVIASVRTNEKGVFSAAKLIPGLYRLYATAHGFKTEVIERTEVGPDRPLVLNLTLRPSLAFSKTGDVEPVKYQNRRNRSIFQATEAEQASTEPDAPSSPFSEMQGRFSYLSGSPAADALPGSTYAVALSQSLGETSSLAASIEGDPARSAPLNLDIKATFLKDAHIISARVGGRRMFAFADDGMTTRTQTELRIADAWSATPGLSVLYGFDLTRLEGDPDLFFLPRAAIQWVPNARLRIQAGLTADGVINSGPVFLEESDPFPAPSRRAVLVASDGADRAAVLNRSFRLEAAAAWQATPSTMLETSVFRDAIDGNPVGVLRAAASSPAILRQDGTTYGLRIALKRQILRRVTVTAGYAIGEGERLAASIVSGPFEFSPTRYQVFTVQAAARFPSSDARLIVGYRKTTGGAVFAIDPFQAQMANFAPGLSVSLIQPLPMWGFIPGKWQILVEGRNLLDQVDEPSADAGAQPRQITAKTVVRGGLGLRF
jgi:hypothetical protein